LELNRDGHADNLGSFVALSRREREILSALYKLHEATAEQLRCRLVGSPHCSTVRALLKTLERKGHICHTAKGLRYVYQPVVSKEDAAKAALKQLLEVFFDNSIESMIKLLVPRMSSEEMGHLPVLLMKLAGERQRAAGTTRREVTSKSEA
jgi:BlaI family penicillinase repressor